MKSPQAADRLVAHRGASADFPENTLIAFAAALEAGARSLEFDVQASADGVPFVIHDPVLMRTAGRHGIVMSMQSRELDRVSVHEPSRFGDRFLPTPLSRLADVVGILNAHASIHAFVELKAHSLRAAGTEALVARVVRDLRTARFAWTLISFEFDAVATARRAGVRCGWVLPAWSEALHVRALELSPDYLFVRTDRVGGAALWPGPWRWVVYETGNREEVLAWLSRGAERVETNSVVRLLGEFKRAP